MKKKNIFIISILLTMILLLGTVEAKEFNENRDYRMLLVGNGSYKHVSSLLGPKYDIPRVKKVFEDAEFYDMNSKEIRAKKDLTADEIIQEIRKTYRDSKENDINYFYFGGHGILKDDVAYITGIDVNNKADKGLISSHELRKELDKIKGTKVIILDSCHSGGFISRKRSIVDDHALEDFNKAFIDEFKYSETRSFSGEEYKIITATSKEDLSWDVPVSEDYGAGGEFSTALVDGLGFMGEYKADKNKDGIITLSEIAVYTIINVKHSPVHVYPSNDDFVFYEYEEIKEYKPDNMELLEGIDFNIRFNKAGIFGYEILKDNKTIYLEKDIKAKKGDNIVKWNGKNMDDENVVDGSYYVNIFTGSGKNKKIIKKMKFDKSSIIDSYNVKVKENKYGDIVNINLDISSNYEGIVNIDLVKDDKIVKNLVYKDVITNEGYKEYNLELKKYRIKYGQNYTILATITQK